MSVLLYNCTTWTLMEHWEKKLSGNYPRMLRAFFNKSWKQYSTKHQFYGHLAPIAQITKTGWAGHSRLWWRSKSKHISNVLLWTPTHRLTSVISLTKIHINQFCVDTGCCLEDFSIVMMQDGERESREFILLTHLDEFTYIHTYIYIYIYIYIILVSVIMQKFCY